MSFHSGVTQYLYDCSFHQRFLKNVHGRTALSLVHGCFFLGSAGASRASSHSTRPIRWRLPRMLPSLEGRLLCLRVFFPCSSSSSIIAFRHSRVVINGTRSAMGFALFHFGAVGKKYLLLFSSSCYSLMVFTAVPRHYFGQQTTITTMGGKILFFFWLLGGIGVVGFSLSFSHLVYYCFPYNERSRYPGQQTQQNAIKKTS